MRRTTAPAVADMICPAILPPGNNPSCGKQPASNDSADYADHDVADYSKSVTLDDDAMPNGLNGLEMIASLRKQRQHEIPAIVLTGDISTDTLREIARYGCVHLNKPVRAKELTRHIQHLLAKPLSVAPQSAAQLPLLLDGEQASTVFVVDDDPPSARQCAICFGQTVMR